MVYQLIDFLKNGVSMCVFPSSVYVYHLTSELSQIYLFFRCAQAFIAHEGSQVEPVSLKLSLAIPGPLPSSSHGAVANVPWQISQLARCLRSSRYRAPSSFRVLLRQHNSAGEASPE